MPGSGGGADSRGSRMWLGAGGQEAAYSGWPRGHAAGGVAGLVCGAGAGAAGGRGAHDGVDLERQRATGAAGDGCEGVPAARRGVDCGDGEPGGVDRRPGEELAGVECEVECDGAVRRTEGEQCAAEPGEPDLELGTDRAGTEH